MMLFLGSCSRLPKGQLPPTKAMMDDYAALGVGRLIPMLGFYNQDNVLERLDGLAAELI